MAVISTPRGPLELLELSGPRPGVVWLVPWQLSLRIKKTADGTVKPSALIISDTTIGLVMQGRGEPGARSEFQDQIQSLTAADAGDETPEQQSDRLRQTAIQENLFERFGVPLPSTMQPPNDIGFIISMTDGGEAVRDNRGRRNKRSTVRIAKEAWLRIADSHRVRLLPSPMLFPSDPLWAPGGFVRNWMSAVCLPFFLDLISQQTPDRPRGLRLAIPTIEQEPGHSIAIQTIEEVFKNERQSRAVCQIQRPRAMTVKEAGIILGLLDPAVIRADEATKFDIETGLITAEERQRARGITNGVFRRRLPEIRAAFQREFERCDPDQARVPQEEEILAQQCFVVESAFERLMLARFLARNPITKNGPGLGDSPDEERKEGFRQAVKIMTFNPRTGRLAIKRDAPWVWRLKKKNLNIEIGPGGTFDPIASTVSNNLIAWIQFLWGVNYFKLADEDAIDLDGVRELAGHVFFGSV